MKLAVGWLALGVALLVLGFWLKAEIDKPDPAYCEFALRHAYEVGETLANRPAACDGIDQATLEEIVGRVLEDVPPPGLR